MPYCIKCKVKVNGSHIHCPLCQNDLTQKDDASENVFPLVPALRHPYRKLIRFIAYFSIIAAAVSVATNMSIPNTRWWSLFVIAGIASLWISFGVVIKKRRNIPKTILWQVGTISILALTWDLFTGFHRWSIDYVLPIICTCAMIAMAVIARIKRLHISDYIFYLIVDSIFGIVPLILILCGVPTIIYPSVICVVGSIASLSALFIFEGTALKAELIRRSHL